MTFDSAWRRKQSILFLLAALAMGSAASIHLDFAARGLQNLTLQIILGTPTVIILLFSILLMLVSSGLTWIFQIYAAKITLVAAVFGWLYFLIAFSVRYLFLSIMIFILPENWLFFLPSVILLFFTTRNSRRAIRMHKVSLEGGNAATQSGNQ